MLINVTKEDIGSGIRSTKLCPVALALSRSISGELMISSKQVCVVINRALMEYELPQEAQDFIHDFDWNKPVEPFSFELDYKME